MSNVHELGVFSRREHQCGNALIIMGCEQVIFLIFLIGGWWGLGGKLTGNCISPETMVLCAIKYQVDPGEHGNEQQTSKSSVPVSASCLESLLWLTARQAISFPPQEHFWSAVETVTKTGSTSQRQQQCIRAEILYRHHFPTHVRILQWPMTIFSLQNY